MEKEKEMAKKYYWLKLKDNFFNQKEVKKLRRIAGGDTYTIIYLKMQLLSIKKDGIIEFEGTEKDLAEQLSYEIDEDLNNIQVTLSFLKVNNLIEEISENNFLLTKVPDCIGKEGASAERVRRHRERKALLEKEKEQKMLQCNGEVTNSNNAVTKCDTEIEKEIEKEIEINKEIEIEKDIEYIWSLYPVKKGKAIAVKKIPKIINSIGKENLIKCIDRYKLEFKNGDYTYMVHGSTFFNGKYVDYLDENYTEGIKNEKPKVKISFGLDNSEFGWKWSNE